MKIIDQINLNTTTQENTVRSQQRLLDLQTHICEWKQFTLLYGFHVTSLFSLDTLIVAAFLISKLLMNKDKNCLHCIPSATKRESTIRSCEGDQFYWCQMRMKEDLPSKIKMPNSKDKKPTVKQYFYLCMTSNKHFKICGASMQVNSFGI